MAKQKARRIDAVTQTGGTIAASTGFVKKSRRKMMSLFGALVGAAIDRSDGDSGIKGAVIGAITSKVASALVPVLVTFVIGWAVQKAASAAWNALPETDGA